MVTKDEQDAIQSDHEYLMYDDDAKIDDMFMVIAVGFVAVIVLVGLFAWEVYSL